MPRPCPGTSALPPAEGVATIHAFRNEKQNQTMVTLGFSVTVGLNPNQYTYLYIIPSCFRKGKESIVTSLKLPPQAWLLILLCIFSK